MKTTRHVTFNETGSSDVADVARRSILLLGRVTLGAQRPLVVKLSRGRSVGRSVCRFVCPVHCGKTADQIRMSFGIVGRTGPVMRQMSVHVLQRRDAALLPYYVCLLYTSPSPRD